MASQFMSVALSLPERIKNLRKERLSSLRPLGEFFDHQRISRPQDLNEATQRITYNTRHFSGNYACLIGILAVYGLLTSPLLLVAIAFLVGGFVAINKFAPEPMQVGEHVVTQKSLYTGLFVIGIPLLWIASPVALLFWLIGSSAVLCLGHAAFIGECIGSHCMGTQMRGRQYADGDCAHTPYITTEPPVSSEYTGVEVSWNTRHLNISCSTRSRLIFLIPLQTV